VAEAGSGSQASYQFCVDGLATLLSKLRTPGGVPGARSAAAVRRLRKLPAPAAAGAPAAAAAAAPAADGDADVLAGPLCNSCWQRGHYKSNRLCPNFGKTALEKLRAFGRAKRVRRSPLFDTSSDEAEESDEEDGNDNVCTRLRPAGRDFRVRHLFTLLARRVPVGGLPRSGHQPG
jgi:hypothetical protein